MHREVFFTMIIVMKAGATTNQVDAIIAEIHKKGYQDHVIRGEKLTVIGAVGDERGKHVLFDLEGLPGVDKLVPILEPYKLASRRERYEASSDHYEGTIVSVGKEAKAGGDRLLIIAGPCAVEDSDQIVETAKAVKAAGAHALRGGAFKPRTSPYSFQGLKEEGLKLLDLARKETGLPVVTEVINLIDLDLVARYADVLQIGARNVQNFPLLSEVGKLDKPVLLKRGMMTTIDEYLMSAEYVLSEGNPNVILCERGIRTFERSTRNTLDISAVAVLKERTHLPIIVDPSHATGHWQYVEPMSRAAIAAGVDGLAIEVHPAPEKAVSDGPQSLKFSTFEKLMKGLSPFAQAAGRKL